MRLLPLSLLLIAACQSPPASDGEPAGAVPDPVAVEAGPTASPVAVADVDLVPATAQDVLDYIAASPARVKVVNFWATWCVPCIEEFPELVRLERDLREAGVDVIFVSADFAEDEERARAFLARQGVEGRAFLKNEKDDPFIAAFDDRWSGELPTTIVYGPDGAKHVVITNPVTYDDLRARIQPFLES